MPGRFASLFARGGPPPAGPPPDLVLPPPPPPDEPLLADDAPPPPAPPPGPLPPPPRPHPERERRDLIRLRELELRDVGGLAVEMARRSDWRYPLLESRATDVLTLEERIHELDAIIAATEMAQRGVPVAQCRCGAPIVQGAHFCAHCGRPAPETPPVVTCSHCANPLPAEANFCSVCGNAVAAEELAAEGGIDETIVEPRPADEDTWTGP
jgi:Double zinc ribbon